MNTTGRPSPTQLALLAGLADLVATRQQAHPVRVAVDGVDAAGKTTLADELGALLAARGRPLIRAGIDGFGRPRTDQPRPSPLLLAHPTRCWSSTACSCYGHS